MSATFNEAAAPLPYNILFVDTETTGLPLRSKPVSAPGQPHITELGFILDIQGREAMVVDTLIYPDKWMQKRDSDGNLTGRLIDPIASEITGITEDMCFEKGIPIADAIDAYMIAAGLADFIVAHNTAFDGPQMEMELVRLNPSVSPSSVHAGKPLFCTMKKLTPICQIPKRDTRSGTRRAANDSNNWKWPKLEEAYFYFFKEKMEKAHSAIHDIRNTRKVFYEAFKLGLFDRELEQIDKQIGRGA